MTTPTIIPGTRPTEVPEVVRGPMFANFGRFAAEYAAGSPLYNHILAMQGLLRCSQCVLHPASGLMWLELWSQNSFSRDYDYQVIDMTIFDADIPYHEYIPIAPSILRDVSQEFILEFNARANILFGPDMIYHTEVPSAAMHNRMLSWTTVHCSHPYGEGFHAIALPSAIYNLLEDYITCFFVEFVEFSAASPCMPHFEIRPMTAQEKGTLRDEFFEWWRVQSRGRPGMDIPAESSLALVGGCVPDLRR